MDAADLASGLFSVHPWHLVIKNHGVDRIPTQHLQPIFATIGREDGISNASNTAWRNRKILGSSSMTRTVLRPATKSGLISFGQRTEAVAM